MDFDQMHFGLSKLCPEIASMPLNSLVYISG